MWQWVAERMIVCTCVSSFSFSSVSSGVRGSASSIFACSSFWTCAEFGISGLRGTYNKHTYTVTHCFRSHASSAKTWADCTGIFNTIMTYRKRSPCIRWFSCSKESPSPAAQRDVVERTESPGCWAALEAEEPGSHPHTHTLCMISPHTLVVQIFSCNHLCDSWCVLYDKTLLCSWQMHLYLADTSL